MCLPHTCRNICFGHTHVISQLSKQVGKRCRRAAHVCSAVYLSTLVTSLPSHHTHMFYDLPKHFTSPIPVPWTLNWSPHPTNLTSPSPPTPQYLLPATHQTSQHNHTFHTPTCSMTVFMMRVALLTSMGNWSVSQPRSGDPVLASMLPSFPYLAHTEESHSTRAPSTDNF